MTTDNTYEGWANYETWAIALEISNSEPLYVKAVAFMNDYRDKPAPYAAFVKSMGLRSQMVWPNASHQFTYGSRKADVDELDRFMRDFLED
jgi:hypothetical protein